MVNVAKMLGILVVVGALGACTAAKKVDDIDVSADKGKRGDLDASRSGLKPWEDPANELYNRVVYFDFDKSEVRTDGQELISKHSVYLAGNPNSKVRLEGHSDERGSREYNIGLGERRSQSVRRVMLFNRVTDSQLETISYGEERPAIEGHDEAAWGKNRRVELVYN